MSHRRTSGAKVRSHKLGFEKGRFLSHKLARLQVKKALKNAANGSDTEWMEL